MRPTIVVNPRTDPAFAGFVQEQVDAHARDDLLTLQGRLQERYPALTIHLRMIANETTIVWYVYRDGRWTDPRPERPA